MKIMLDFNETGLEIFFRGWEIELLCYLLKERETDSMRAYKEVVHLISRASVINFLNRLYELGFCIKTGVSTRGGWKGVYKLKYDIKSELDIYDEQVNMIVNKFHEKRIE